MGRGNPQQNRYHPLPMTFEEGGGLLYTPTITIILILISVRRWVLNDDKNLSDETVIGAEKATSPPPVCSDGIGWVGYQGE